MRTWTRFIGTIALTFFVPRASAQEPSAESFSAGVSAYRTQAYDAAQRSFERALKDDAVLASPRAQAATLFNLGNVAFRQGHVVRAVAHYTAASRLLPRDPDIASNLSMARAEAGLEPAVPADLGSTLLYALRSFTKPEAERVLIGAFLLWLVALLFEAFRGGALARTLAWAGLALVLFSFVPYFATAANAPRGRSMIVPSLGTQDEARAGSGPRRGAGDKAARVAASFAGLHSEPRTSSATLAQLAAATEVVVTDRLPGWVEVRHEGRVGWMEEGRLAPSDPRSKRVRSEASVELSTP